MYKSAVSTQRINRGSAVYQIESEHGLPHVKIVENGDTEQIFGVVATEPVFHYEDNYWHFDVARSGILIMPPPDDVALWFKRGEIGHVYLEELPFPETNIYIRNLDKVTLHGNLPNGEPVRFCWNEQAGAFTQVNE